MPTPPRNIRDLDRRQFIKSGSLITLASLVLRQHLLANGITPSAAPAGGCDPTTDDILGPYYLPEGRKEGMPRVLQDTNVRSDDEF